LCGENKESKGPPSQERNTHQLRVADELAGEPEEGLLEVIVGLGGNIVVLQVLLAVEGDGLGLDLALLHVNLVAAQDNGNVLADTDEITETFWDVLLGDTRVYIKHDDTALAVDVVTVTETTELLLAGGIPHVELDLAEVGGETEGVNFHTKGGHVLLLEFTSQMALDKRGLASATIADKHKLEGRGLLLSHLGGWLCGRFSRCKQAGCWTMIGQLL
jgi:hypothetical protein